MLDLVPENLDRVLIAACFFLAILGVCFITRPHREKPRNVRRESGNTVPRQPNVRRPTASLAASNALDADWAESVSAATLARLDVMSPAELRGTLVRSGIIDEAGALTDAYKPGPRQGVSVWDEPTLTSPRGEK